MTIANVSGLATLMNDIETYESEEIKKKTFASINVEIESSLI